MRHGSELRTFRHHAVKKHAFYAEFSWVVVDVGSPSSERPNGISELRYTSTVRTYVREVKRVLVLTYRRLRLI